jgi:hypothetical protein
MQLPAYRNSTVQALENGLGFRKRPVDNDYSLRGDKNIFSCSLQLLTELSSY